MIVTIKREEYYQQENEDTNDAEEPKEVLGIMSEISSIVFLIPLLNPLAFISKHTIDLTDMALHLSHHTQVFFSKHVFNPLPVLISDPD